jgi:hypothetical protein
MVVIERPKIERVEKVVTITREVNAVPELMASMYETQFCLIFLAQILYMGCMSVFPLGQVPVEKVIEKQVVRKVFPVVVFNPRGAQLLKSTCNPGHCGAHHR